MGWEKSWVVGLGHKIDQWAGLIEGERLFNGGVACQLPLEFLQLRRGAKTTK